MRRPGRRVVPVASACALAAFLLAGSALADKVVVLPFQSISAATSVELDAARAATRNAVTALSHTLPTDAEMLTAQMSSKDGVVDSGQEYVAAGHASTSAWTVAGHIDAHGPTYHLELEVCQVERSRPRSPRRRSARCSRSYCGPRGSRTRPSRGSAPRPLRLPPRPS
jgi:hypothetical protein